MRAFKIRNPLGGLMAQHPLKLLLLALLSTSLPAISAPKYLVSPEDVNEHSVLKFQDRLSFGLQLYSVVPSSRPFQSVSGSTVADYQYQISTAFGVEVFYRFGKNLDLGLSTAWEVYEAQLEQGSSLEVQTARMRLFPIEAIAKWQWSQGVWAPELEGGLGVGIFNMDVTSTNIGQARVKDSSMALLGHVAGGVSLAWFEHTNIGVGVGYRLMLSQQKDFDATIVTIRRKSLSGIYAKANLRYHF